ncbi:hypothetical protein [Gordonia aquimaris]|uniref:Uncharacterized protein n=1 Tax=Gordonia aquimaris TaxID=2984863 RepID=A0A9X3D6U2_9ACTN|nr:hypothetical protein [Gordonia aquimaris]MCX2966219.1 hypothetical protein [Gordonia aquimaris]
MNVLIARYTMIWRRTAAERPAVRMYHRAVLVLIMAVPFAAIGLAMTAVPGQTTLPEAIRVTIAEVTLIPVSVAALLLTVATVYLLIDLALPRRERLGPRDIENI